MELVTRIRGLTGRRSRRTAIAALAVGGFTTSAIVSSAGAASGHRAKSVVVSTTKIAAPGTILLVSGKTVYTLKASTTPCSAQCVKVWPEVLLPRHVKHATAGAGVKAAKLGTIRRRGGALQVTYSGRALYWFSGDKAPGQIHGNVTDTWGAWSVVAIATEPGTSFPAASETPTTPAPTATTPSTSTTRATTPTPATSPPPATMPTPSTTPPAPPTTTPTTSPPPPPTTTPTTSPTTTTTAPSTGGVSF